jgi:hypothetical protein
MTLNYELPTIKNYTDEDYEVMGNFMETLIHNYLQGNNETSLVYWMQRFSTEEQGIRAIYWLSKERYIVSNVVHNYATVGLNPDWVKEHYNIEDVNKEIAKRKISKGSPKLEGCSNTATNVSVYSGIKETGLVRYGLAKAGTNKFTYDIGMIIKYKRDIVRFSVKSMKKMEKKLKRSLRLDEGYDYESIIEQVIDLIIDSGDLEYALGKLLLDSRGRAIHEAVRTIFNPISNKMARALVMAPPELATDESKRNAYLYISEMLHGHEGNIFRKARKGRKAFSEREYLDLDTTKEKDLDDLFENVWLERIYNDLEACEKNPNHLVTAAIEVDFSASNMTIIGLLLGHQDYVDHTKYMWNIEGLSKNHVKFAQTPYVFGGKKSIVVYWTDKKLEFTKEQVTTMQYEMRKGKFSVANRLKDIIIDHCHPEEFQEVNVRGHNHVVECNKHQRVLETTKQHIVYDSVKDQFSAIEHSTTVAIPDLNKFRTYFMTGLIHSVDSSVLDYICLHMDWILPIHDAGIVSWSGATKMRKLALREMQDLRREGRSIIEYYLESINIDDKGWAKYLQLLNDVDELNKDMKEFTISEYILK